MGMLHLSFTQYTFWSIIWVKEARKCKSIYQCHGILTIYLRIIIDVVKIMRLRFFSYLAHKEFQNIITISVVY